MPDFSLADQIRCIEREIKQRERVYPRLIGSGRMKSEIAAREIATMQAVLRTLQGLPDVVPADLFAPPKGVRWA